MSTQPQLVRIAAFCCIAACAASCAGNGDSSDQRWVAKGWLSPTPQGEAEIIGEYSERAKCEAAVDDWLTHQVVGNPVHAECLPA